MRATPVAAKCGFLGARPDRCGVGAAVYDCTQAGPILACDWNGHSCFRLDDLDRGGNGPIGVALLYRLIASDRCRRPHMVVQHSAGIGERRCNL